MNKVKIDIKRLGAIVDSKIEITPVMVFSGESGLGKSYAAILSHYVFDVLLSSTRLDHFFEDKKIKFIAERPKYKNSGTAFILQKKELEEWLSQDAVSYMKYMLKNDDIQAEIQITLPSKIKKDIQVDFEEEYVGIVNSEEVYVKLSMMGLTYRVKEDTIGAESPYATLLRYGLTKSIFGSYRALQGTYVFPPSRGPVLTEEIFPKTGLYQKFKFGLSIIDMISPHPENVSDELISLFKQILDGSVHRIDGKYLYRTHEQEIPVSAAAASVRELAALSMLVERFDISKVAMLIEEPEAHLHPLKQRMMADIISALCNGGAYMQITTHSDYFLRRLNELIKLTKIYSLKGEDEYNKICENLGVNPKLKFNYRNLSAYLLERNEDGTSVIKRQELEYGVPFESFSEAINESLRIGSDLDSILDNDCI